MVKMHRGIPLAVVSAVLVGAVTLAAGAAPARTLSTHASSSTKWTYVYAGNREVGHIYRESGYWYASWAENEGGAWAYRQDARVFFSGYESERSAHRSAVARKRTIHRWSVSTFPGFRALGTMIWAAPGRWLILNKHGKRIGRTQGPSGIPAGLVWLDDSCGGGGCH
jgi:hypothetical protein